MNRHRHHPSPRGPPNRASPLPSHPQSQSRQRTPHLPLSAFQNANGNFEFNLVALAYRLPEARPPSPARKPRAIAPLSPQPHPTYTHHRQNVSAAIWIHSARSYSGSAPSSVRLPKMLTRLAGLFVPPTFFTFVLSHLGPFVPLLMFLWRMEPCAIMTLLLRLRSCVAG